MSVLILRGDATALPLPDGSIDAVCCDPPYALGFMGREWDTFAGADIGLGGQARVERRQEVTPQGAGHSTSAGPYLAAGVDSLRAAGQPFQRWCTEWAREAFRVLKPGGHLLAFGGTRTAHRLVCGIEDAGFEVRDTITWIYASGFPKSLDVSKAIDRRRNDLADVRGVAAWLAEQFRARGVDHRAVAREFGFAESMVRHWLGKTGERQTQCPSWEHWERLRAIVGFGDEMDAEVWRLNGRKGTPGEAWHEREIVGARTTGIGTGRGAVAYIGDSDDRTVTAPATDAARRWSGWGTALKPASEPIVVARKPIASTVAANVLEHGTGALNIDGCRVGTTDVLVGSGTPPLQYGGANARPFHETAEPLGVRQHAAGRWPSNVVWTHAPDCDPGGECATGCPVAELDAQSGNRPGAADQRHLTKPRSMFTGALLGEYAGYNDSGGASRFFPVFRYEPKAPSHERPADDDTQHPTVKPVDLMRWLVRLVTPPGGVVLDCFAGSGTTGEAALLEGFDCVLVEKHAPYLPLIRQRLAPYADPTTLARARGRGVTPRRGRRAADPDGDLLSLLEAP